MQMTGEQRIAAPRERVWEALNDPEILKASIPGCQSLDKDGDDGFAAVAEVKIGPIGARFKGKVQLTDIDAPNGYTINGQGNGGVAGNAKGRAKVRLSDDGGGTLVSYEVDAEVGGRMAQLGGPIIDATAKQLAGKFFTNFGEVVGGAEQAATEPAPAAQAAVQALPASQEPAAPLAPPSVVSVQAAPAQHSGGSPWGLVFTVALAILAGFLLGRSAVADWWVIAVMVVVAAATAAGFEAGRRSGENS